MEKSMGEKIKIKTLNTLFQLIECGDLLVQKCKKKKNSL